MTASDDDDAKTRAYHARVEAEARRVGEALAEGMPPGLGFTLFVFEQGRDSGFVAYLSTATRGDMVRVIDEWLARQRDGL